MISIEKYVKIPNKDYTLFQKLNKKFKFDEKPPLNPKYDAFNYSPEAYIGVLILISKLYNTQINKLNCEILDICSGPGEHFKIFDRYNIDIKGIDICKEVIEYAQSKNRNIIKEDMYKTKQHAEVITLIHPPTLNIKKLAKKLAKLKYTYLITDLHIANELENYNHKIIPKYVKSYYPILALKKE